MRALAALLALAVLAGCAGTAAPADAGAGPSLPDALLGPGTSTILVEVSAVDGRWPDLGALDHLRATLADVTGKAVTVTGPTPIAPRGGPYLEEDLRRIHAATTAFGPGGFQDLALGRTRLHVLYLDGRMEGDDGGHRTLGRSLVDAGVVAIFRDAYAGAYREGADGGRTPAAHELDRHVLLHEVGHTLGLVGNGIPMVRDHDADGHPGHSRYPESVMYHHPPMTPRQLVTGPVSIAFDVDDLADLAAHRARLRRA